MESEDTSVMFVVTGRRFEMGAISEENLKTISTFATNMSVLLAIILFMQDSMKTVSNMYEKLGGDDT